MLLDQLVQIKQLSGGSRAQGGRGGSRQPAGRAPGARATRSLSQQPLCPRIADQLMEETQPSTGTQK